MFGKFKFQLKLRKKGPKICSNSYHFDDYLIIHLKILIIGFVQRWLFANFKNNMSILHNILKVRNHKSKFHFNLVSLDHVQEVDDQFIF